MITKLFKNDGTDFSALRKVKQYLTDNNYSYGPLQRHDPVGVQKGDHYIPKWRHIDETIRIELDGFFAGNGREGNILLCIKENEKVVKTKEEIEGGWYFSPRKCACCGEELVHAPWIDHFNSVYWGKARGDFMLLYICPNNCLLKDAIKKRKEFRLLAGYVKDGSTPFNYEIDFTTFKNAWIDPNGKCYPVTKQGHIDFAYHLNEEGDIHLEKKGWAKITEVSWHAVCVTTRGFSKRQLETIFDFCIAHNLSTEGLFDSHGIFDFVKI